jgi:sugar phosphate isomerase/epimerase
MKSFLPALVFLLSCVSELPAQQGQSLVPDRLGIQTYSFRNSMQNGIGPVLDTIKSMGVSIIEGEAAPKGMTPEAFKTVLDEKGISCVSIGASYDDIIKDPSRIAHEARVVGATYVMVAWIPHEKAFDKQAASKAIDDFNRVGKILKDSGVTFCYHTHGYEFVRSGKGNLFDEIVAKTNPDYVSFEMDIMWVYFGGQDPAKLLLKYPGRFPLMHVKDLRKGVKGNLTGGTDTENDVTVGTGQLNIPAIIEAAKKSGVKYYFIEDESSRISTQIPATIEYLKTLN